MNYELVTTQPPLPRFTGERGRKKMFSGCFAAKSAEKQPENS
jgi:hypothetical protein